MSLGSPFSSGGVAARRAAEFGQTHIVKPKGKHQATIVWLHGLGDSGGNWSHILETLHLPNIKWICPTAPTRPVRVFGGSPAASWFDVGELDEDAPDDVRGLDTSAAHVANLLSNEPTDIRIGLGGFSMGAAATLYCATCFASGRYGNGSPYPPNLSAILGISGWLPCAKSLGDRVEDDKAASRASSLPVLLCHGTADVCVPYKYGEQSSQKLSAAGFKDLTFKSYDGVGHHTVPHEINDICSWLKSKLNLQG